MPFEGVFCCSGGVMLLLLRHILQHGWQMFLGETDDAIASLPFQSPSPKSLVHFMGTGAFDFSNEVTQFNKRFELKDQMDVGFRAADSFEMNPFDLGAVFLDEGVAVGLDSGCEQRAIFGAMPIQVEEYFAEIVARSIRHSAEAFLKAALKRAVVRGQFISTPAKAGCKEEPAEAG